MLLAMKYTCSGALHRENYFHVFSVALGLYAINRLDNQVKIRVVRKRTVVIDVPTAEILYVDEY